MKMPKKGSAGKTVKVRCLKGEKMKDCLERNADKVKG